MKAIRLYGKRDLRLCDIPVPEISDDEMLVRVRAASICGTDLRMYRNGAAGADEEHPLTLGHEFAGEIAKVGSRVTGYTPGQRVAVAPNMGCGICDACVSGNTHCCSRMKAFGVSIDGGFAEYVKIPAQAVLQGNIYPLGPQITFEAAALIEPLSCVYNGQMLLGIRPGDDVLVIGAGPIGMMHIMMARILGAGKILVHNRSRGRVDLAKKMFPDVLPVYGDIREGLKAYGLPGVDVCIVACASAEAQALSLELMNMNGRLLFFGGLPNDRKIVPIDTNIIHYKQLKIQGCSKQSISQYRTCAKLADDGCIPMHLMTSDTYPAEAFQEAFDRADASEGLKHIFVFG